MYYRSDWPEVGLKTALNEFRLVHSNTYHDDNLDLVQESKISGATFRWVATKSEFESDLYRFPVWNLRLEVDDADGIMLTARLESVTLRGYIKETLRQLFDMLPWDTAYIYTKVVKEEPLYYALLQFGFEEVEFRRIYMCKVRDLTSKPLCSSLKSIIFTSLAAISPEQLSQYREQIFNICCEAFEKGYSRHFSDPFLLRRLPGFTYILRSMELNFKRVAPNHFLLAVDTSCDRLCGFSVVGIKPGLGENTYTQLLSAVQKTYRGRGIYRDLTQLLSQTLPQDAILLNITHVGALAMQRAYQDSGRVHLADTVVLSRVLKAEH